ncbi:response regulator transcription factor, partial [Sulfurospirillum sp. T05]
TDKEYLLKAVDLHLEHYIVKPINLTTLTDALLRCAKRISKHQSLHIKLPKDYTYDADHKELRYYNKLIKLTKKEVGFLELLLANTHRVVTYQELQDNVWQDDVMTDSALRSLVRNLRKKLPSDFITNLSGVGYKIALH